MERRMAIIYLALFSAFLILSQTAYAIEVSIQPPRMVLRMDAPGTASGTIKVFNPNDVQMKMETDIFGDIQNRTVLKITNATLEPNETVGVDFEVYIDEPGEYGGEIIFILTTNDIKNKGAALSSAIYILADWEVLNEDPVGEKPGDGGQEIINGGEVTGNVVAYEGIALTMFALIAVILTVAVIVYVKRRD